MNGVFLLKKLLIVLFSFVLLLQACGTNEETPNSKANGDLPPIQAEVTEGDFTYRLYSEKESYKEFEDLQIYAEIIYTGQEDSIDIYHGASPFSFPFEELTRGFDVPYAMDLPLIVTTIEKNEPFRKKYTFAGGYSDRDQAEFVHFVRTIMKDGFPEGEYIIHGGANFWTETEDGKHDYLLTADIGFEVKQ